MIAITVMDDELVETVETFRVNLSRVIGGARLGEMTSVTVSIPPNDSPLGSFGILEPEVSPNSAHQSPSVRLCWFTNTSTPDSSRFEVSRRFLSRSLSVSRIFQGILPQRRLSRWYAVRGGRAQ